MLVAIPSDNKETQSDLDKNSNEDIKDNEVHPCSQAECAGCPQNSICHYETSSDVDEELDTYF